MEYLHSTVPSVTRVCYYVPEFPWTLISTAIAEGNQGYGRPAYHDKVRRLIIGSTLPDIDIPTASVIGTTSQAGSVRTLQYRGYRPVHIPYVPYRDFKRYGDAFHQFASVLGQRKPISLSNYITLKKEKGVQHVKPNGSARAGSRSTSQYYTFNTDVDYDTLFGFSVPIYTRVQNHWHNGTTGISERSIVDGGSGVPLRFATGSRTDNAPAFPCTTIESFEFLESLVNGEFFDTKIRDPYAGSKYYITTRYSNFSFTYGPTNLSASYTLYTFVSSNANSTPEQPLNAYDWAVSWNCHIASSLGHYGPVDSVGNDYLINLPILYINVQQDHFDYKRVGGGPAVPAWPADDYDRTFLSYPIIFAEPSNSQQIVKSYDYPENVRSFFDDPGPLNVLHGDHTRLSGFQAAVLANLDEIRPSSIRSFNVAVSNFEGALKNNNLEMLAEISTLFKILPDFFKATRAWSLLRSGKIIQAIDAILDFATDTHLLVEFGIKPNSRAMLEVIDKSESIIDRLLSPSSGRTVYGSFTYDLPSEPFGYQKVKLITRSKVRMGITGSSLQATLMSSAALGVQPNLSNFWDIVPFSFVVDWFVGMGNRFDNIDNYIKSFVYETHYCVHSYTIIADVDKDDLSKFDMIGDVNLSFYRREVSAFPPSIRESKFDFDQPTHSPNIGIVGSLVYQLLH